MWRFDLIVKGPEAPAHLTEANRSKIKLSGKQPGWVCTELLLWRAGIYGEFYRLKLRKWSGVTHWYMLYTQYNTIHTIHTTQPCRCVNLSVCDGWKHQVCSVTLRWSKHFHSNSERHCITSCQTDRQTHHRNPLIKQLIRYHSIDYIVWLSW